MEEGAKRTPRYLDAHFDTNGCARAPSWAGDGWAITSVIVDSRFLSVFRSLVVRRPCVKRGMCRQRQRWMGVMESEGITVQQHWANTAELACPPFFVGQAIGPITCYPSSGGSPAALAGQPPRTPFSRDHRNGKSRELRHGGGTGGDFEIRVRLEDCVFLDKIRLVGRDVKAA